ncbi:MAG: type I restriction enzyme HsdR N-terminal domain-containing protein [Desulfobacterales bacterium]|nr:type I restriction enzyme HsdR N-terminal domain-containing protein [Desulfobacterales bacterium]
MDGHHLILGKLTDIITGEILNDTHDERYRQKIAGLLINGKGYERHDIVPRSRIMAVAGEKKAMLHIDFLVGPMGTKGMIIQYGPGSLVTRHRSVLAMSRLVEPYQIPVVVVTNGIDADILSGSTCNVVSHGLETIPSKKELADLIRKNELKKVSAKRVELESRILYTYEVDGACPCDDTICRL